MTFLMYIFMYMGGQSMTKCTSDKAYWRKAILPIAAFTLNMGLRWGRGIDYNNGYYGFQRIINDIEEDREPVWVFSQKLFGWMGFDWHAAVVFFSFFLVLSVVFFLKDHKRILPYALPLFAFYVFPSENLIRWFYAFSFFLIAIPSRFEDNEKSLGFLKSKRFLVFSCLAFLTHYGMIIIIGLYSVFFINKKTAISPYISIFAFIIVSLFSNVEQLSFLSTYIEQINVFSRFQDYQENANDWLTNSIGDYEASMSITSGICVPIVLYYGYWLATKIDRGLIPYYNIMTFMLILFPIMVQVQMLYRIALMGFLLQFLFIPYIITYRRDLTVISKSKSQYKNNRYKMAHKLILFILVFVTVRSMIVMPFVKEKNEVLYIWDANGRKTLPV